MNKRDIKVLVLDVDGTMTDGKVYIGETGEMFKGFNIKDGLGIHDILPHKGIMPIIITGRKSIILENRCKEIGIVNVFQGVSDKISVLKDFLSRNNYELYQCAYIGDDINDLECMRQVGTVGCPSDAVKEVIEIADFVSTKQGGDGAVREFIEWLN